MMNKVGLVIICAGIFFLASCKEKVCKELRILIQNSTDGLIHVSLYPKVTSESDIIYTPCEDCGRYQHAEFDLSPGNNVPIYLSKDLSIAPYTLTSNTFDSIHICLPDKDSVIIRFTPEKVTGYSENIFAENAAWDFSIQEYDEQYMLGSTLGRYYLYSFLILEDKIIIE